MKKLIALSCAAAMLISTSFAQTFSDLPETHWAQKVVEEMVREKIISGYTDGTFRPAKNISKIESLILLARIAGINKNTEAANKYYETYTTALSKYTTQYKKDVAYLLGTKVLETSDLDNLLAADQVNAPITREEMAVLITKVMGKNEEVKKNSLIILPFDDVASITTNAKPYVYYVYSQKIMAGVDAKNFSPKTNVTRAQAACILQRIYKKVNIKPDISNSSENTSSNNNSSGNTATGKISVLTGTITKIDTNLQTVFIKDSNGNTEEYEYDSSTEFYVNTLKKTADEMAKDLSVTVTLKDETYITLMKITKNTTETITGTISDFDTTTKTITVNKNSKNTTYEYTSSTKFYLDGKSSTAAKSLKKNYSITLTITDEEVTKAEIKQASNSTEQTLIGKIKKADDDDGYIIIEDDDGKEYILMDDYIDEYSENDEDYYFDDDSEFTYNGSSKTYKSIATSSYLYKKGYYLKLTMNKSDYLTNIDVASKKSNLEDDDSEPLDEIIGEIVEAEKEDGYLIIEDDDGKEYILMDEYLDEYNDGDEDYYFDDATKFSYNALSKTYSAISSSSYLYKEGLYARVTLDDDEYIEKIELAAKSTAFNSSSSTDYNTINDGYQLGYIIDMYDDELIIEDEDGEEYAFEIADDCIIIEKSSNDPEDDLYYYVDDYEDVLYEDDEVMVFVYKTKSSKYYTSLIVLFD